MERRIILILLLGFTSCSAATRQIPFQYQQDFSPPESGNYMRDQRLEYADIRAEGNLSSRNLRSWRLTDGGVEVTGSRRDEMVRREKMVKEKYKGNESFVTIRGYRVPWLTLSLGDSDWVDYIVKGSVRLTKKCTAGIAFRYQNSRQYYALMLGDQGKASLVLRTQGREASMGREAWRYLKTVAFKVVPNKTYNIKIEVKGVHINCWVEDKKIIEFEDLTLDKGKVALLADNPAFFGSVSVEGTLIRTPLPPLPNCAKPELRYEVELPKDCKPLGYFFLDVDTDGEREIVIAEKDKNGYGYRCLEFDGSERWHIPGIKNPTMEGGDRPIQAFDINGDDQNELVVVIDFEIQVREGKTAKLIYSQATPKPNPYYDSANYRYPLLLGDAICPAKLNTQDPPGLYIKDRYTNIWLYNHKLELQWHKALNTGHFPMPMDLEGDGVEELLVCHTLLRADGKEIWSLPLSDHVDNVSYESLDPGNKPKRFYLAAGEMGLLEVGAESGRIFNRKELGHIQFIRIADFLPEKPGLELLTQTWWREDQLHYLFDKDMILQATWQAPTGNTEVLPWGEGGRDLLLTATGIRDPLTGRKIRDSFGKYEMVLDDPRWGNGVVYVSGDNTIRVYGPEKDFKTPSKKRPYQKIQSNYFPIVALPVP